MSIWWGSWTRTWNARDSGPNNTKPKRSQIFAKWRIKWISSALPCPPRHTSKWRRFFLKRKVPVLVEKPITATVEQARALTKLARDNGVCLQVGHIERFQPAFKAAKQLEFEPRFIEAHRLAPFSFRSTDIGVVHDLMIHDLELVLHLVQSPIQNVQANGGAVLSAAEDIASARIEFENGAVANLTASRISLNTMRKMRVFSPDVFLSLDFDKKYAFSARKKPDFEERMQGQWATLAATPTDQLKTVAAVAFRDLIELKELDLDDQEPLYAELNSFVESVRANAEPEVAGEEAMRALEAAELVLEKIKSCPW